MRDSYGGSTEGDSTEGWGARSKGGGRGGKGKGKSGKGKRRRATPGYREDRGIDQAYLSTDNDPQMTWWMNTVTKSTHNSLFNNRKTAIRYDSWVFDSTHPLATRAGELQDEIVEMVDRYRGEVNAARQTLAPPPTPLGDFSSQLSNQIMITANALCAGRSGS